MSLVPAILDPRWWFLRKKFAEEYGGPFSEINDKGYVVAVVSRGEQLFYEDIQGAVTVPLSLHDRCIDTRTIGVNISIVRKKLIIGRLKLYFDNYQGYTIRVIDNQIETSE